MLQRDREQSCPLSKWINLTKAEAAKLKICGPQVCVRGNACGKHGGRQACSHAERGRCWKRSASECRKLPGRDLCGVGNVTPNSFETCRLLEQPQSPITPVKVKPFTNLPPKAGWQPTRFPARLLPLIRFPLLLHKVSSCSANRATTEIHLIFSVRMVMELDLLGNFSWKAGDKISTERFTPV